MSLRSRHSTQRLAKWVREGSPEVRELALAFIATRKATEDNLYKAEFDVCASKGSLPLPPSQQSAELLTQFTQDVDLRQSRVIDVPDGGETVTVPAVNGRILDLD